VTPPHTAYPKLWWPASYCLRPIVDAQRCVA